MTSCKKKLILLCLLLSGVLPSALCSQDNLESTIKDTSAVMHPIQADRPDQTETPFLVPKGYFQVEMGFSITDTDPGYLYAYPSALWKYGVNQFFEVRLTTQYITVEHSPDPDQHGFLPLVVGMKAKLAKQHGIFPEMALIGQLRVPGIVSDSFQVTYLAPDLRMAFSHSISELFSLGYNFGLIWNGNDGEPNVVYSLTTGFSLTDRLNAFAEVYGATPQRQKEDLPLYADAGLTYLLSNDFLIDVSASQGIAGDATERYISTGFSYRFK